MASIDLNADLGEGVRTATLDEAALDDGLLAVVTSANVACGGHAGDDDSMRRVCASAAARGVVVGAQVSYADRAGFGRTRLDVDADVLVSQLLAQITALRGHARAAGTEVAYLKPHGALYNTAVEDAAVADVVLDAVLRDAETSGRALPVVTLADGSLARRAAARGLVVVAEVFADRAYTAAGRLLPRHEPGAVLLDHEVVVERVLAMVVAGRVRSHDGVELEVRAESVCLHSDTEGALELAHAVAVALRAEGVALAPAVLP
jgi:5-oxoprolinase (ATP-hydrolysing) subunit A